MANKIHSSDSDETVEIQQNGSEKKICPLRKLLALDGENIECFEEKCAWWDTVEKQCAIKLMGEESGLRLRERDAGRPWQ